MLIKIKSRLRDGNMNNKMIQFWTRDAMRFREVFGNRIPQNNPPANPIPTNTLPATPLIDALANTMYIVRNGMIVDLSADPKIVKSALGMVDKE